jgi:cobalt-zinc-cadmium efflux system outer membrane protein
MIRFIIAVCLAALAGVARVDAQQAADVPVESFASRFFDPQNGLTLAQALTRAREHEPSLRASRTAIDAARGSRQQAALRPNPTLSVEHRGEPGGTDRQTMVSVEVPLDLFRKPGRTAVADRELEVARFEVADRERLLIGDVRERYGEVLAAVRELGVSDDLVAGITQEHHVLSARVEQGASPPLDRDVIEVELRRVEAERLLLAARAEAAVVELKRLLGFRPDEPLKVSETLESAVARDRATAASSLDQTAALKRPDVLQADAAVRAGDARLDRARREGRVDVSLFGGYTRMDAGFPQLGFTADGRLERVRGMFNYVAAGAMVTVPVRDRNQGAVAEAAAMRAGAAARYEAARLAAAADVAAAVARTSYASRAVSIFTDGARALARNNLDVVRVSYALGRATLVDVVSEQRQYLDTERAYTEALTEAYQARTALVRALGEVP